MKVLTVLTYYRPHTSGLTIYAERLAKALVRAGHEVTVLTMQYEDHLPRNEVVDGVKIIRVPVVFRVSKGVIAPTFGFHATKLLFAHDVVHLHLPQFDAAGVALRGAVFNKPTFITYHCDLQLPSGAFNWCVNRVVDLMNDVAARCSKKIVTYTEDYAGSSPYLQRFQKKLAIIPPPVELPIASESELQAFKAQLGDVKRPRIGMAARLASEKGVEVLLDALDHVHKERPDASVLFAGQYQDVLGEAEYFEKLRPKIESLQKSGHWKFLGILNPSQMACFYKELDLLVVPSLNSTESFGLVQIEAMMNGVPVVASNLPGVRQPVKITKMGLIAEIGDAKDLADKMLTILKDPGTYKANGEAIRQQFSPENTAKAYENLYLGR